MSFFMPSLGRAGPTNTRIEDSGLEESLISIYRLS
jgi:hypothetical protein